MRRTRIVVGTRDELAGEAVGAANVWERDGHDGLSVALVFDARNVVVSVGEMFMAGGVEHRLVAIRPHPATDGYELVIEAEDPAPPAQAERPPAEYVPWVEIRRQSGHAIAETLRTITPAVLAALGAGPLAVDAWERTSHDSYTHSWPGEQLGPSTETRHVAVLSPPTRAEASVTTNTIRWSPDDVTFVEVSGSWVVGEDRVWCWGRGEKTAPLDQISLRGPDAATALVAAALAQPEDGSP